MIYLYSHGHTGATVTAILGLTVALLTCAMIPVDIFLVSSMKNGDGTFKVCGVVATSTLLISPLFQSWAESQSNRDSVTNSVTYAYYGVSHVSQGT